jgi:hypothetical protein
MNLFALFLVACFVGGMLFEVALASAAGLLSACR